MTESEWLECTSPETLVRYVGLDKTRKLRLFSCACCRRIWNILVDDRSRQAVEVSELFADGKISQNELDASIRASGDACENLEEKCLASSPKDELRIAENLWNAAEMAWMATVGYHAIEIARDYTGFSTNTLSLVRCVFANPFRPVTLDPRWLTSTVIDLATAIYDEKAYDRMPILADALMDAGCDHEEIIAHCRSAEPHVRGCWVVDLLLGKDQ